MPPDEMEGPPRQGSGDAAALSFDLLTQSLSAALLRGAAPDDVAARRATFTRRLGRLVQQVTRVLSPELVVEIGAHEGDFARRAKAALPAARVVAFEANPAVHARYQAAFRLAGVEHHNLAVREAPLPTILKVPLHANGAMREHMGSILSGLGAEAVNSVEVQGVALDGFLGEESLRPSAIWLDVEGAIGTVLAGARQTLSQCLLFYAEVESVARWSGQATDVEVFAILRQAGLHPVLRDFQRSWQYNALFLSQAALCRAEVRRLLSHFVAQASAEGGLDPKQQG